MHVGGCIMEKAAFIILITDKYGDEAKKELDHIREQVLSISKFWRLERISIVPEESDTESPK